MSVLQPIRALRPTLSLLPLATLRPGSSGSSRWKARQSTDPFTRAAKEDNLRSRAAYKLQAIHKRNRIFRDGQTVVDLGYAPGSWSQVAVAITGPAGVVVGVDLLPVAPPLGVVGVQGDFLEGGTREGIWRVVVGRRKEVWERMGGGKGKKGEKEGKPDVFDESKVAIDVVLSDMLMNTSGIPFRDHMGSMKLCNAALDFAEQTLKFGGNFVCKYYQGAEDKLLENRLKSLFKKVFREKPDASRKDSKEAFFVGIGFKHKRNNTALERKHEDSQASVEKQDTQIH